jgi:hypothetical protein
MGANNEPGCHNVTVCVRVLFELISNQSQSNRNFFREYGKQSYVCDFSNAYGCYEV